LSAALLGAAGLDAVDQGGGRDAHRLAQPEEGIDGRRIEAAGVERPT
jgi:hypothetical protein